MRTVCRSRGAVGKVGHPGESRLCKTPGTIRLLCVHAHRPFSELAQLRWLRRQANLLGFSVCSTSLRAPALLINTKYGMHICMWAGNKDKFPCQQG
jgi:hypothetical protein